MVSLHQAVAALTMITQKLLGVLYYFHDYGSKAPYPNGMRVMSPWGVVSTDPLSNLFRPFPVIYQDRHYFNPFTQIRNRCLAYKIDRPKAM